MNRRTLSPPMIGELEGLRSAAMATGDHTELRIRVLALHREGWDYTDLASAVGLPVPRVKKMAQQADRDKM